MRKKLIVHLIIIGIATLTYGAILHIKLLPTYIAKQAKVEARIAKIADEIRTGERVLDAQKTANLLQAVADRSPEKYIVSFYVHLSVVAVSISLFHYLFGFYVGLKEGLKK